MDGQTIISGGVGTGTGTGAGRLIVLEGPEGAGKTSQLEALAAGIAARGYRVVTTREPGGTPAGEAIREVVLSSSGLAIGPRTEALLILAARAQHVDDVVAPALAGGAIVVCDRFSGSTYAYQGGGRGLPLTALREVQRFAAAGVTPDLNVLLDVAPEIGLGRRREASALNRLDAADIAFHRRVRAAYLALAAEEPERWAVVDAARSAPEVARALLAAALACCGAPAGRAAAEGNDAVGSGTTGATMATATGRC